MDLGDKFGLQFRATARTSNVPQVKCGVEVKFYSTSYKFTLKRLLMKV